MADLLGRETTQNSGGGPKLPLSSLTPRAGPGPLLRYVCIGVPTLVATQPRPLDTEDAHWDGQHLVLCPCCGDIRPSSVPQHQVSHAVDAGLLTHPRAERWLVDPHLWRVNTVRPSGYKEVWTVQVHIVRPSGYKEVWIDCIQPRSTVRPSGYNMWIGYVIQHSGEVVYMLELHPFLEETSCILLIVIVLTTPTWLFYMGLEYCHNSNLKKMFKRPVNLCLKTQPCKKGLRFRV